MKYLLVLACIGACSFNEKGFDNRTCAADSDCPRPDQSCQEGACVLRSCSAASDCGADFVFDCKDGACVASGCTTDSECGLGYTCENRFCQASFNVSTADSGGNTAMTVTFDAPPDPTSATDLANYAVSGLTLSGTPVLAGSTVTITTSAQMAKSYTVTVKNVTRAADGVQLRGETAAFTGRPTFDVTSAVSASSRSVLVAFDAPPDAAAMSVASYTLSDNLALTGAPIVLGNTVTLITSAQAPISYTVTVTGVHRASDNEPLTATSATFMGRGDFSVISATPIDANTVKVSFNNPPDMVQAATLGNYQIPGLSLSGIPVVSGNDIFLMTSNQQAKLYTVTVSNVTRASDGEALVTSSADFVGVTPFDVSSAVAATTSKVTVTFDAPPNTTQAGNAANYNIPGLAISAAAVSGNTVTLTTALQTATTYNLTVTGVTRASDGEPLSINTASFAGRTPFDVTMVQGLTSHTVAVTFDAPPDPVQAQSVSSYVITGLTINQATLTGPSTVTLTTSGQMAQTYTVTVNGVRRMSDAEPLTTNSGTFTGRTSFNVMTAMAQTSSTFLLTFDAPPDPTAANNPANYSITNLTVVDATYTSGNSVVITTSPQLAQTYTVTVSNVTRQADGEPLSVQSASFVGRVPFDVSLAKSTHTTTIQVSFDAAPVPAQATDITNYSIPGLALTGTPVLVGQTVTLTTSTQAATTYTVTVANVTRMSDGEPLTNPSATFTGRAPFDVTGAVSVTSHSVQLAFDAAPDVVSATTASNYAVAPGVSVTGVSLSGNTVTLTTSAQSATSFTVTVKNVTRASDGETLTGNTATFNGRAPFDVASAAATTSKQFTLTFDAPPDPTAATDTTNYTASGGLVISGVTYPGTGNTVTVTTSTQSATSYTVTVNTVTRASDGEPLTLTSASFTGRPAFDVASATSVGNTKMTVTFDAAPEPTSATNPANYAITAGSLSLSGTPTLSGNVVTLTTTTQTAGATYQITVSNVIRNSDSEPLTNKSATFTGKAGFNVVDATSVNQTTITVTYDALPNAGQATTLGSYSVKDSHANTLSLSGVPTLNTTTNTVTITTAAQIDETYTVTVTGVTRASDSAPLTVNVAQFVHQTFNVASAKALTSHSVQVTFSDPPGTGATTLGNYTIKCGGSCTLGVSGTPTVSGNTVTITTAAQTGGVNYTITVANVTRASDGDPLNTKSATFAGIATFNVSAAASVSSASISVTFDAPPNPAAAQNISNYMISGGSLTLNGTPVLVGSTVTINTSPQAAVTYTVTVTNVTRASDNEALTGNSKTFTGIAQTKPTVSSVAVNTTAPDNGTTFFNTGTAAVTINGSQFTGVACPAGVVLDDTDGNGTAVATHPTSCTVVSDTVITATFPAGIKSNYAGWDILVTNAVGQSTAGATDKLIIKAGLLIGSVYVRTDNSSNFNHQYFEIFNPTANAIDITNVTGGSPAAPLSMHVFDGFNDQTITYAKITPAPGSYPSIPSHKFMLISSSQSSADTWYSHADASYSVASTSPGPHLVSNGTLYLSLSSTAQSKVLDKMGWGGTTTLARCEGTCTQNEKDGDSNQRLPGAGSGAYTDLDNNTGDFKGWSSTLNPLGTKDPAQ